MKAKYTFVFFLSVAALSCEDRIDKQLLTSGSDLLVVEAILTNEKINHKITLTHPYQELNGTAVPASGATIVVLEGDDVVYTVTEEPVGSGEYYTEEMIAVFGKLYTLYIQYQGKEFFAQSGSVPIQSMESLQYDRVNNNDLYQLRLNESGNDPYFIDHSISWKNTVSCLPGETCEGIIFFYDLKTIDVNERFKADQTRFGFPVNSVVIRKKYSVSPGYKTFLRSMLSETEWRGGVFDVQRANASSNLSEGAIGYFAVSTVLSDTTIILEKP